MIQILKDSMIHFNQIKEVKKLPFGKLISYLLLLSLVMALPLAAQVKEVFHSIKQDSLTIVSHLPDFSIKNGKLQLHDKNEKGFIYQTDTVIFTFDPEAKRTKQEITNDHLGNFISAGLTKDELLIGFPSTELTSNLLGGNKLAISYNNPILDGITSQKIKQEVKNSQFPIWMYGLIILLVLYPAFVNLAINIFTVALIGNIYSHMIRCKNGFLDNLKMMIACASLPVLLSLIISFIYPEFDTGLFITLGSFFIFTQALKDETKMKLK